MITIRNLRRTVSQLMTEIHLITPQLADYHVAGMDQVELWRRFRMYTGTELSVEGRNQHSGSDFYQVFGFATATARLSALNPVPEQSTEHEDGQEESARAGSKKPGPIVDRALSAIH
jgi:hypothetical protein